MLMMLLHCSLVAALSCMSVSLIVSTSAVDYLERLIMQQIYSLRHSIV